MKENQREELLKHLAASLHDAKKEGGAILLVGAGISVSAGIPPAQKLMQIAIENFSNYFTEEEKEQSIEDLNKLQYNDIMTKLSNVKRKELFKWFIEGNPEKGIEKAKLNFAHIAIAELLKQGYFSRILTVNFDPLLIHACYMVGMYPFPAIYDLGAMGKVNAELLHDPSIVYLNGQHVGFVQRNTTDQLEAHKETLSQIVRSTGCSKTWVVAGYSGENDHLMDALNELRPYNNWLYWLEYSNQVLQKESHNFLENDEECKVIYECDADETFMNISYLLDCSLDFIERPHKELEMYLEEIRFETSKNSQHRYTAKIKKYIEILETNTAISQFKHADQVDMLLAYLEDLIANKIPSPHEDNLKKIIEVCERISQLSPEHDATYWYWGDALFATAKLEGIDKKEFLKEAEIKYQLSIEKDISEDINIKARKLYELYRYQHFLTNDETTKNDLLKKALASLNLCTELSLEKAKIYSLLNEPKLAVSHLNKIRYKNKNTSILGSLFSFLNYSIEDVISDEDFRPIKNHPDFQHWVEQKQKESISA
ncbi:MULTISPECIES: hypothetical protein [Acinetobacter]|uniref:hypothetical protein n=1 Tax=Acinetobacter TaxID=469 RepID=UPI002090F58D|nr:MULTISPECIES: hypothetical protein [Acinetobacter]MDD0801043.1 hypothetical protein [Acinetobacter sp. Gutcm_16]